MSNLEGSQPDPNPAVRDLRRGLEAALDEIDAGIEIPEHFVGVKGFYKDNLKINKLAYRAIRHFHLPILHTWYRYGQWAPQDVLRPKRLDISPLSNPDFAGNYDHPRKDPPTREEIKWFLIDEGIEEMMDQPLFEFLRDNYEELAPEEFKELYLANLGLLEVLEEFWQDNSQLEKLPEYRKQFRQSSIDIQYQLASNPYFDEEIISHVETGLYAIEDVLISLENKDTSSNSQIRTARRARELYHTSVWSLPAYVISIQEASGPDTEVEKFRESGKENLEDLRSEAPKELQEWKDIIRQQELRPSGEDYYAADGEMPQCFISLEQSMLKTTNG